ncbi:MAG TPA: hypothetical protein VK469_22720 [Candidatus Kapabacteria bacterium]|nr:hypothetical protein [Candidatus Kapabacteria bacterium]
MIGASSFQFTSNKTRIKLQTPPWPDSDIIDEIHAWSVPVRVRPWLLYFHAPEKAFDRSTRDYLKKKPDFTLARIIYRIMICK